ncbi:hypothetical protein LXL04_021764 [Taraxacum kok-saghyz]
MEINHRTEIHRTTVEREKSTEGSLRRCWLSEVVRKKKMVAVGFHVEVNRVILSSPSMISSFKSLYTVYVLFSIDALPHNHHHRWRSASFSLKPFTGRQNPGLSHMAYHGAVHSRFEHSFGVYWLAGNAVEKLKAHQILWRAWFSAELEFEIPFVGDSVTNSIPKIVYYMNTNKVQCIPTERLVLTELKNSLVDRANRLSSWSGKDCCGWSGVVCDNLTHHVQELHLRGPDDGIHGHCHGSYDTDDEF